MQKTTQQFRKSFDKQRDRYKPGWLTKLPFADEFADWTVSSYGISILIEDFDVLMQSTMEAVRITKPGGTVAMIPFLTSWGSMEVEDRLQRTHNALFDKLVHQGIGQVIVEKVLFSENRLKIIKSV